jgi:hypothetical protein
MRLITLAAIALVLAAAPAPAQRLAPSGVTRHDIPLRADTLSSTASKEEGSRLVGAAHGALIGAGVGAVGGLLTAVVLSTSVTDHSEDFIAYVALTAIGTLAGLVGGAIIGAVSAR